MVWDEDTWMSLFHVKIALRSYADSWTLTRDNNISLGGSWKQHREYAFARFSCSYCDHSWASAHVLILFHMQLGKWSMRDSRRRRKGSVKMRIFKQMCESCKKGKLEEPEFEMGNIEIILGNLVLSIGQHFYGEYEEEALQEIIVEERLKGPHKSAFCEACQLGVCNRKTSERRNASHAPPYSLQSTTPIAFSEAHMHAQKEDQPCSCCSLCRFCFICALGIILFAFLYSIKG
ncbi:receptor-transporting protein 2-like [Rhinatrema bivittatum]|uniref:receptor-transporting protein 2-like n=1 Tax=Rhinatrema bivittatum TaxID=194408 RepID=UPI0011299D70|nr:receptor-transporting protein 2-like [Rhinatrema bivittatum]